MTREKTNMITRGERPFTTNSIFEMYFSALIGSNGYIIENIHIEEVPHFSIDIKGGENNKEVEYFYQ